MGDEIDIVREALWQKIDALESENEKLRAELDACTAIFACQDCTVNFCDDHSEQLNEGRRGGA